MKKYCKQMSRELQHFLFESFRQEVKSIAIFDRLCKDGETEA